VAAAFDAVAEGYDEAYSTRADRAENKIVYATACALYHFGERGRFIDLGCGPGTAIPYLRDQGNLSIPADRYLGIDPSPEMVRVAQDAYASAGWRFRVGDEQNCVRMEAQMILGAFGPMQYVDDLGFFANSIRMSLAPGGRFLLMGRPRKVPTRVLGSDALTRPYSAVQVRNRFAGWSSFDIYGLRSHTPRWLPVPLQVPGLFRDQTKLSDPALCDWLVIEGHKI